ncbi:unnamed protein product [Oppiella nova]|uniref:Uncharacterized protein n=1 Tax=Oppiella nova TaxID=334625 RepID=A0A7R9L886_9ACAR|nr:unnamed protein product [Oppiella nova]CAG2158510.1 unnamed protein product [Oppiella nova]
MGVRRLKRLSRAVQDINILSDIEPVDNRFRCLIEDYGRHVVLMGVEANACSEWSEWTSAWVTKDVEMCDIFEILICESLSSSLLFALTISCSLSLSFTTTLFVCFFDTLSTY